MAAVVVVEREDVEEERFDVVVERLVVEKQLGKKAEVLAIYLGNVAIHFEHRQIAVAVDLVTRWPQKQTLGLNENNNSEVI